MVEAWLLPNRRALVVNFVIAGIVLVTGATFVCGWPFPHPVARIAGGLALLYGFTSIASFVYQYRVPRLAYSDGQLLVFLGTRCPYQVPIEAVEVFFLGQGPSELPGRRGEESESANVVVRLAESAKQWQQQPVKRSLGSWCDGYITIRGAWCEPIHGDLIRRLNARLVEVHREQKASA